ncbi:MAG: hypothetical protein KAR06_04760 [Deltaproteobacteria bacterium]|nr:hypothetical protein [Deltaproteobacteria bacterium]
MAKEIRHADVVLNRITENEYEAASEHISDGGATDDLVVVQADETLIGKPVNTAISGHIATSDAHHAKYTNAEAKTQAEGAKLDDHAAPDDNTDLDASGAKHGLMPKADKTKIDTVATNADVTGSNAPQAHKDSHDPEDGSDPLDAAAAGEIVGVAAAAEGTSHSLARADHTHQVQHSIADNHIVTVAGAPNSAEYAKFTANGLEGRTYAELIADLGLNSRARGYQDAQNQSIPTGPWTKVLLDAETYDELGEFNNRTLTANADATEANKLHDADGGFEAGDVGATIWNTTDDTYTTVTGFVDSGELDLADNIMANGEGYVLYHSRFTAIAAGYYLVCGGIRYPDTDTAEKYCWVAVYKNGTSHCSASGNISTDTAIIASCVSDIIYLDGATDYLELFTLHNQTAKDDIESKSSSTYLAIHRLS